MREEERANERATWDKNVSSNSCTRAHLVITIVVTINQWDVTLEWRRPVYYLRFLINHIDRRTQVSNFNKAILTSLHVSHWMNRNWDRPLPHHKLPLTAVQVPMKREEKLYRKDGSLSARVTDIDVVFFSFLVFVLSALLPHGPQTTKKNRTNAISYFPCYQHILQIQSMVGDPTRSNNQGTRTENILKYEHTKK